MRAIAVLLVLAYHAGIHGFGGGYIGVDVFFVISGYLITGLLARELIDTGQVELGDFYLRRIRRLLPASALVAIATFIGGLALLPPVRLMDLRGDALATVTYLANVRFAQTGTDYLAAVNESPFQHYWSLALEEQFYVLWPVLLVLSIKFGRRSRVEPTVAMLTTVTAVVIASFALSVSLTPVNQPWAFFLLPSRAWELSAGGALALASMKWRIAPPQAVAKTLLAVGAVLIGASAWGLDDATAFPGWIAIVPVAGALMVLAGGESAGTISRVLRARVLQSIGKRSYAIYLWHWPLLVLAGGTSTGSLGMGWRLLLLASSIGLAWATFRYVEAPLRFHRLLVEHRIRTVNVAAGVTVVCVALALMVTAPRSLQTGVQASETEGLGLEHLLARAPNDVVPDDLEPALSDARADIPRLYHDGCHLGFRGVEPPDDCVYGDRGSSRTMVLFGDSHAAHWFPALEEIARTDGWRLVSRTKSSCNPYDLDWRRNGRLYEECLRWRSGVVDEMVDMQPDLLVLSGRYGHGPAAVDSAQWSIGIRGTLERLAGIPTVVLGNMPIPTGDVPVCLSAHLDSATDCVVELDEARSAVHIDSERHTVESAGAAYIDLPEMLCTDEICPVFAGNRLFYRDNHHLTAEFSRYLATELRPLLLNALPPRKPDGGA